MYPRRTVTTQLLATVFAVSLIRNVSWAADPGAAVSRATRRTLIDLDRVSRHLASRGIPPRAWQETVEHLLARIELADLLAVIHYDRLSSELVIPENHELAERIALAPVDGLREPLGFAPFFFAVSPTTAIVPHGHHNMVSMHMVLEGRARARQYDRIANDGDHVIIRPTSDRVLGRGAVSTVSDQRDNVHWFTAETDRVLMFNMQLWDLQKGETTSGRDYIDPLAAESVGSEQLRARRLTEREAYARYRARPT